MPPLRIGLPPLEIWFALIHNVIMNKYIHVTITVTFDIILLVKVNTNSNESTKVLVQYSLCRHFPRHWHHARGIARACMSY